MNQRAHRHNGGAARELRLRETWAEELLWEALRGRRLDGLKFRRQHPMGPFVLDFCCVERRIAIELDGGVHETQLEQDAAREELLIANGFRVLRFPNEDIFDRLPQVLEQIREAARGERPARPPGPGRTSGWT